MVVDGRMSLPQALAGATAMISGDLARQRRFALSLEIVGVLLAAAWRTVSASTGGCEPYGIGRPGECRGGRNNARQQVWLSTEHSGVHPERETRLEPLGAQYAESGS
jgi:hypothetical protein